MSMAGSLGPFHYYLDGKGEVNEIGFKVREAKRVNGYERGTTYVVKLFVSLTFTTYDRGELVVSYI